MTSNSSVTHLSILCSNIRGKFKDLKEILSENALDFTFLNHFANGSLPMLYQKMFFLKNVVYSTQTDVITTNHRRASSTQAITNWRLWMLLNQNQMYFSN